MTTDFCVMEDCDQEPEYCRGHFEAEDKRANQMNNRVQEAGLLLRNLLTHLERAGVHNADVDAARRWFF